MTADVWSLNWPIRRRTVKQPRCGVKRSAPAKPGQANPSPAKPVQIKWLGFAWFYSSESGLINGLQRIPNKNFPPRHSPCRPKRASPGAPSFSDYWDDVGRLPIFARGESKNCWVSLIQLGLPVADRARALARFARAGRRRLLCVPSRWSVAIDLCRLSRRRPLSERAFMKVPFLHDLAPTQSEPPFAVTQGIVLLAFTALGITSTELRRQFTQSLWGVRATARQFKTPKGSQAKCRSELLQLKVNDLRDCMNTKETGSAQNTCPRLVSPK